MKKIRVLVIGCGNMGSSHARAYHNLEQFELVGIVDGFKPNVDKFCEWAKKVCGVDKICGIIGGFHLFDDDEKLAKTVDYFVQNKIEKLYPCHCVSLVARHRMMEKLDVAEVAAGLQIEIEVEKE